MERDEDFEPEPDRWRVVEAFVEVDDEVDDEADVAVVAMIPPMNAIGMNRSVIIRGSASHLMFGVRQVNEGRVLDDERQRTLVRHCRFAQTLFGPSEDLPIVHRGRPRHRPGANGAASVAWEK